MLCSMRQLRFVVLAIWLAGCGSGDLAEQSQFFSQFPASGGQLVGRVAPGFPLAAAKVTFQTLDGQTLPLAVATDRTGNFVVPAAVLPADFRIRVQPGGTGPELLREVRQMPALGGTYSLNVVTHLVSLYWQAHRQQSLAEAEEVVGRSLGLRPGVDLGSVGERSEFSHLVFYLKAAPQGGLASYSQQWASQLSGPPPATPPFQLRGPRSLRGSLQGLEAELAAPALQLLDKTAPVVGVGPQSQSYVLSLFDEVAQDELHGLVENGAGWLASALGFNFLPSQELGNLLEQVDDVETEVSQILSQVVLGFVTTEYTNQTNFLQTSATSVIDGLTSQLASAVDAANLPAVNTPYAPNPTVGGALSNLTSYDARLSLNLIQSSMLGLGNNPNLVHLYAQLQAANLGAQVQGPFLDYPLRSNASLAAFPLGYYYGYQVLALRLMLEAQHSQRSLALAINQNLGLLRSSLLSLKRQTIQQPQALERDDILLDMQYGKMWCLQVQDNQNYATAQQLASGFKLGSYTSGWRLPTYDDFKTLQQRGRYLPGQNHDYGKVTRGLSLLGFSDVSLIDGQGGDEVWMTEHDPLPVETSRTVLFKLNHENNDQASIASNDEKTKKPVILVRDFPGDSDKNPMAARASASVTGPITLSLGSLAGNVTLRNTLTGTNTTRSFTLPRVQARADFLLASGGNFQVGQAGDSPTSVTLPYTGLHYNDDVTDLIQWSIYKSDPTLPDYAEISNAPGKEGVLLWHPDSSGALHSVTVNATLPGLTSSFQPTTLSANLTIAPPANFEYQLKTIGITPRNVLFTTTPPPQGTNVFFATGFYTDGSAVDLTRQVRWEVLDPSTQLPVDPAQAVFSSGSPGVLIIGKVTLPSLIIRASQGSVSDTTPIQVSN